MATGPDFSFKNIKGGIAVTLYDDFQNLSTALSDAIVAEVDAREQGNNTLTGDIDELNTKLNTISSFVSSATHFIGVFETLPETGNPGDICIVKAELSSPIEYIYSESNGWQEFGNENIYYTKADADSIHQELTSLISSVSSETLTSAHTELTAVTTPINNRLSVLENANLISADSFANDTYTLNNKKLTINGIQLGLSDSWGTQIKLQGGTGDFIIGNNVTGKNLVLETNGNSQIIKLNSNVLVAMGISCANNIVSTLNDNTLATTKFVKTNLSSISAELTTTINNEVTARQDAINTITATTIPNTITTLTNLISTTSAETLTSAANAAQTKVSTLSNDLTSLINSVSGITLTSADNNAATKDETLSNALTGLISSTSAEITSMSNNVITGLSNTVANTYISATEYNTLTGTLSTAISSIISDYTTSAQVSAIAEAKDQILSNQITSLNSAVNNITSDITTITATTIPTAKNELTSLISTVSAETLTQSKTYTDEEVSTLSDEVFGKIDTINTTVDTIVQEQLTPVTNTIATLDTKLSNIAKLFDSLGLFVDDGTFQYTADGQTITGITKLSNPKVFDITTNTLTIPSSHIDGTFDNVSISNITELTSLNTVLVDNNINEFNCVINMPVVILSDNTFSHCSSLTSITLPNTLLSIGTVVFGYCTALSTITIPETVEQIGAYAFNECSSLTSVDLPSSLTSINNYVFSNCSSLTSITLPSVLTFIDYNAFNECRSLQSINIPDSVSSIGNYAFSNCTSLTSITLPSSLTMINYGTFYNCVSLTSIVIPNKVTYIDENAFYNCSSLKELSLPSSLYNIRYRAFYYCPQDCQITFDKPMASVAAMSNKYWGIRTGAQISCTDGVITITGSSTETFMSPTTVKYLDGTISSYNISNIISGGEAGPRTPTTQIDNVQNITDLSIGLGITTIGVDAFSQCSSLTSIVIPETVEQINAYAFNECSALPTITIPNGVTDISFVAFSYCSSLTSITFPGTLTSVGGHVFEGCPRIFVSWNTNINTVTSMADYPFGLQTGSIISCLDMTVTIN